VFAATLNDRQPWDTLDFTITALHQVAMGICHLHHTQPLIVHADLKPENIFIDSKLHCKVGDLGGSVLLYDYASHPKAAVTMLYASPKRMRRIKSLRAARRAGGAPFASQDAWLSLADDTYAFGVTIYDALVRGDENMLFDHLEDADLINGVSSGDLLVEKELPSKSLYDTSFIRRSFPAASELEIKQCGQALLELLHDCTMYDENKRPHFTGVCRRLLAIQEMRLSLSKQAEAAAQHAAMTVVEAPLSPESPAPRRSSRSRSRIGAARRKSVYDVDELSQSPRSPEGLVASEASPSTSSAQKRKQSRKKSIYYEEDEVSEV